MARQPSATKKRWHHCRVCICARTKPLTPSAFLGAPCRRGSPPALLAFAVLVAQYYSPLRTFRRRLTASESRQSESRNHAIGQSRPARSQRRCPQPAAGRQRANVKCSGSHPSRLHSSQPCPARVLVPDQRNHPTCDDTVSRSAVWRYSHDHTTTVSPRRCHHRYQPVAAGSREPLRGHLLLHSRPPEARSHRRRTTNNPLSTSESSRNGFREVFLSSSLGNNWQICRLLLPIPATWCKANSQLVCLIM